MNEALDAATSKFQKPIDVFWEITLLSFCESEKLITAQSFHESSFVACLSRRHQYKCETTTCKAGGLTHEVSTHPCRPGQEPTEQR